MRLTLHAKVGLPFWFIRTKQNYLSLSWPCQYPEDLPLVTSRKRAIYTINQSLLYCHLADRPIILFPSRKVPGYSTRPLVIMYGVASLIVTATVIPLLGVVAVCLRFIVRLRLKPTFVGVDDWLIAFSTVLVLAQGAIQITGETR